MRRYLLLGVLALPAGCSLLVPLDALEGGSADAGIDAPAEAATSDAGPETCAEPGLVAHYRFDDTSDVLHNCVPDAGLDGVIKQSAVVVPGGVSGSAFKLLALDGYAEIQGSHPVFAQGSVTVAVWINVRSYDNHGRILSNRAPDDAGGAPASLDLTVEGADDAGGGVGFYVSKDPNNIVLGQLPRNTWMHVAGVHRAGTTGGSSELWIDGQLVRKVPDTREPSSVAMRIGNEYRPNFFGFDGLIDELRIYERALDTAEIQALAKR